MLYFESSSLCRLVNAQVGETSRRAWLGAVEAEPTTESLSPFEVYNRLTGDTLKEAFVSGLGRLGIKQGNADLADGNKAAKKRIEMRKVVA